MGMINPNADTLGVFQQMIQNQQGGGGGGGGSNYYGGGSNSEVSMDPIEQFRRMGNMKQGFAENALKYEAQIQKEAAEDAAARQMELISSINEAHAQKELASLDEQQPLNDRILQLESELDDYQSKLTQAEMELGKSNPEVQQKLRDHQREMEIKYEAELKNRELIGDPDAAMDETNRARMRGELKNRRLIGWNRITSQGGKLGLNNNTLGTSIGHGVEEAGDWLRRALGGDNIRKASVWNVSGMDPRAIALAGAWDNGRFGKMLDPSFENEMPKAMREGNDLAAELGGEIISDALDGLGQGTNKTLETKQGVTKLLKELFGATATTGNADQNFEKLKPTLEGLSLAMFGVENREHNVIQFISSHLKDFSNDAAESSAALIPLSAGALTGEAVQKAAQMEVQSRLGRLGNMLSGFTKNRYITDTDYSKKIAAMKAAYRSETGSFEPGMFRDTEFRKAVTPQLSTELDALTKLIEGKKTAEVDVAQAKLRSATESRVQKLRTGPQAARREQAAGMKIDKAAARKVRRYLGR